MLLRIILLALIGLALSACTAAPPLPAEGVEKTLSPREAVQEIGRLAGTQVMWGGRVIASRNLEESTQLEVLAYPLGGDQRPDLQREPLGRFLVDHPGYLETASYAPGRVVTVLGPLTAVQDGLVGQARYRYPEVRAERIHLWPAETRSRTRPRVSFGVGVILGR